MKNRIHVILALAMFSLLPRLALAGQYMWRGDDRPTAITRWWINSQYRWGEAFPVFVSVLALFTVSLIYLIVTLVCRHFHGTGNVKKKRELEPPIEHVR